MRRRRIRRALLRRGLAGATVHLDRDVRQPQIGKQLLVHGRFLGLVRYDRDFARKQAGADRPYVQVDDARVVKPLERFANGIPERTWRLPSKERPGAVAQQCVGPARDEAGTDNAQEGVHPDRPQVLSGDERNDREQ